MQIAKLRSVLCTRTIALLAMTICMSWLCSCSDLQDPIGSGGGGGETSSIGSSAAGAASGEKWTLLLYIAADVPGMIDPFEYFAPQLHSNDNLDVLILDDRSGETAKIWFIDENRTPVLLEDAGEMNLGSPSTLSYFLDYAKTNCPADRYIVSFYGHGGAWSGACPDLDPGFDVLRMDDFKSTLSAFGGVDIVLFMACTMGAIESAYELKDCTDVYISNENLAVFLFWVKTFDSICRELEYNPSVSSHELGRLMIEWMERDRKGHLQFGYIQYWSSAAIRTDNIAALKDAIDDLALGYMPDPEHFIALVESAAKKIPYFPNCTSVDLNTLLACLYDSENDMAMKMNIENAMSRLSDAIIAESHFLRYPDMRGISIFLPDDAGAADLPYYVHPTFGLDFVLDTRWDELLYSVYPAMTAPAFSKAGPGISRPEEYFKSPGL